MKIKKLPPVEVLRNRFDYNPETGELTWKINTGGRRVGSIAGYTNPDGYTYVKVNGGLFLAHRVCWAMYHGVDPYPHLVDHTHGIENGNGIENLRLANHTVNGGNRKTDVRNSSGFRGVYFNKQAKKWMARIKVRGEHIYLGLFKTPEDAFSARLRAEQEHGVFVR